MESSGRNISCPSGRCYFIMTFIIIRPTTQPQPSVPEHIIVKYMIQIKNDILKSDNNLVKMLTEHFNQTLFFRVLCAFSWTVTLYCFIK